jgi:hypothetical protein
VARTGNDLERDAERFGRRAATLERIDGVVGSPDDGAACPKAGELVERNPW